MGAEHGEYIDHIDHDGLNNRRENLRRCTNRENIRNQRGPHHSNTSGFLGVARSGRSRWQARVMANGKDNNIGIFDTAYEAALARDHFIREHCPSEFWTFNVPLLPGERGIGHAERPSR
jgi:hypothetical protein